MTTGDARVTRVTIPLRHRDMDTLGHLNQSLYHTFLEEARAALLIELFGTDEFGVVLARVELDHRREVVLRDVRVHSEAWVQRVGRSSIGMGVRMLKDDGTVVAEGTSVFVGWHREERRSRPFDDHERAALLAAVGSPE